MPSPEHLLVSAVIKNKTKKALTQNNFTPENLIRCKDELNFILNSKSIPSRRVFNSKFPNFVIHNIPESDIENLIAQCKENKVRNDFTSLLLDSSKRISAGETPINILHNHMNKARGIDVKYSNIVDVDISDNVRAYMLDYVSKSKMINEGGMSGVPYGIDYMDEISGGLQNKELVTIAARTSVGKTWMMCKMAAHASLSGYKVAFFSLEMDWLSITNRIYTIISYEISKNKMDGGSKNGKHKGKIADVLYNTDLNLGKIPTKKVLRVVKEIKSRMNDSIVIPDIPGKFSIASSGEKIESIEPNVSFFDYFGLTQSSNSGNKNIEGWQQASDASKLAKEIARTYNIPYVMGAQLNRSGANTSSPSLDQISLTDAIGQDSDKVFMLVPVSNRGDKLHVICSKFRGGPNDWRVVLNWDVNKGVITQSNVIKE